MTAANRFRFYSMIAIPREPKSPFHDGLYFEIGLPAGSPATAKARVLKYFDAVITSGPRLDPARYDSKGKRVSR